MIEIDIRTLQPPDITRQLSPGVLQGVLISIADAARAKWIQLSFERLHTSQQEYTKGISRVKRKLGVAWIELNGSFPNMIENGFSPFDLRETLLDPSKRGVRTSADGHRYRSIFFRRGGAGTTGRNAPKANDLYAAQLGERRAKAIGQAAMNKARKLGPGEQLPEGVGGAHALKAGERSPAGHVVQHGHKTDLFAGMTRTEQKTKGGKTQAVYGVFRTISTGVPEGWIHPGYAPGAHLAQEVERYMARVAPQMFAAVAGGKGSSGV